MQLAVAGRIGPEFSCDLFAVRWELWVDVVLMGSQPGFLLPLQLHFGSLNPMMLLKALLSAAKSMVWVQVPSEFPAFAVQESRHRDILTMNKTSVVFVLLLSVNHFAESECFRGHTGTLKSVQEMFYAPQSLRKRTGVKRSQKSKLFELRAPIQVILIRSSSCWFRLWL
jgi:hypothetical protein